MRPALWITTASGQDKPLTLLARDLLKRRGDCDVVADIGESDTILVVDDANLLLPDMVRFWQLGSDRPIFFHLEADWPLVVFPGTYPSLHRQGSSTTRAASWSYLAACRAASWHAEMEPDLKFSFLGRFETHPVRLKIANLHSSESPCLDVSMARTAIPNFDYNRTYQQLLVRSQFVLCPRGYGASSIRIFEAMAVGRVPVIISDRWVPPPVGDWSAFSIRVDENQVEQIPSLTSLAAGRSKEMGKEARRIFVQNFAGETFFDRIMEDMKNRRDVRLGLFDSLLQNDWRRQLRSAAHNMLRLRQ